MKEVKMSNSFSKWNKKNDTAGVSIIAREREVDGIKKLVGCQDRARLSALGIQRNLTEDFIQVCLPHAKSAYIETPENKMRCQLRKGWFTLRSSKPRGLRDLPKHYRIYWEDEASHLYNEIDPYTFEHQISDFDLYLFKEGRQFFPQKFLGANHWEVDGIKGVFFATWAPNASHVSVIGDFNAWNGLRHPMRYRGESGIWELFIPEICSGSRYEFEIQNQASGHIFRKADAYGRAFEHSPKTSSVIASESDFVWADQNWLKSRHRWKNKEAPVSIYEIHVGAWKKNKDGGVLNFREIAKTLVPHVKDLGFSHIELLPLLGSHYDGSLGCQISGYYAFDSRYGSADDFRYFVDYCHQHDIGVICDWLGSHFSKDLEGLSTYDGDPIYEYSKDSETKYRDDSASIFDYGRNEVRNFLIGNALFWLDEFHVDGLRVDTIDSMLYHDYARIERNSVPNKHGSNQNIEAMCFLQTLNHAIHNHLPDVLTIAEDAKSWPLVTFKEYLGGLGFSMKWNKGWMNDTLSYFNKNAVSRTQSQDQLTFGVLYAFKERFCLALSHDDAMHKRSSLLESMPGEEWEKRANLRLLYSYIYSFPGKKLLFMGAELAQRPVLCDEESLDLKLMNEPRYLGIYNLIRDLNFLYKQLPPLHEKDYDVAGFRWIDHHSNSIISYCRYSRDRHVIVVLNLTCQTRHDYRVGVPIKDAYIEVFSSDAGDYGGSDKRNLPTLMSKPEPSADFDNSVLLTLPPFAAIFLCPESQMPREIIAEK